MTYEVPDVASISTILTQRWPRTTAVIFVPPVVLNPLPSISLVAVAIGLVLCCNFERLERIERITLGNGGRNRVGITVRVHDRTATNDTESSLHVLFDFFLFFVEVFNLRSRQPK